LILAWKLGMPTNNGWLHRGVAYWRDGEDERVIMLTGHGAMIALDAKTGRPIQTFGDKGSVDLVEGLRRPAVPRWVYGNTSPPVVVRDVIVVIGSPTSTIRFRWAAPGTRGFDVRTVGWCDLPSVPELGEIGHETWENDAGKTRRRTPGR
jgi:quinoprotein glucose dehydrogenase